MLPLSVLKDNVQQERDKTADMSSFVEAIANDLVKSTLGPKLMEEILFNAAGDPQNVQVTNDGATTSKFIGVDNPAAKIPMSMAQGTEVGDGTTSVTVLASELLREAEKLIEMHFDPQSIISGYKIGLEIAKKALRDASNESTDTSKDDLLRIARTILSSKILSQHKEHFAKLAVDAVLRLKGSGDLDTVQIIKKLGASMEDSYLDEGFLLEKKPGMYQPQRVENAKILIANTPMDTDKFKVFASRVDSLPKDTEFEAAEKKKMKDKVNKIIDLGINIFINRQRIYNYSEQLFADAKIMAIEHADFEGLERLALALGGEIVSTFDAPEAVKFSKCDVIEKVIIGEDELLRFSGVQKGEACSIVLRGSTQRILDEAERSLHDALCILISHIRHGGASEALMAAAVLREAQKVASGNESIAVEAFGRVLLQLPTITCDNAGLDSAELISHIHAEHVKGNHILNRPLDGVELKILEWKSLHLQIDRERKKETNLLAANGFTATDFAKAKEDVLHKGTPEGVMPIDIYDSVLAVENGYEPLILKLNLMEATSQQLQDCIRENIENEPC